MLGKWKIINREWTSLSQNIVIPAGVFISKIVWAYKQRSPVKEVEEKTDCSQRKRSGKVKDKTTKKGRRRGEGSWQEGEEQEGMKIVHSKFVAWGLLRCGAFVRQFDRTFVVYIWNLRDCCVNEQLVCVWLLNDAASAARCLFRWCVYSWML